MLPLAHFSRLSYLVILRDLGVQKLDLRKHHRADLPFVVGVLERLLYVAAWLLGHAEFIGFWLALKVAGGWIGWSDTLKIPVIPGAEAKIEVPGRLIFNTHLIASILSVLSALVGALMIQELLADNWPRALWIGTLAALVPFAVWLWFMRQYRRSPIDEHAA